jgi:hypothetical protein
MAFVSIKITIDNNDEIYYTYFEKIKQVVFNSRNITYVQLSSRKDIINCMFITHIYGGETITLEYMFLEDLEFIRNYLELAICGFCNSQIDSGDVIYYKNILYHSVCYCCVNESNESETDHDKMLYSILEMGFSYNLASDALYKTKYDFDKAVELLRGEKEIIKIGIDGYQTSMFTKSDENSGKPYDQIENDMFWGDPLPKKETYSWRDEKDELFDDVTKEEFINRLISQNKMLNDEISRLENILKNNGISF